MKAFRYILLSLLLCMSAACSADNGQNDEASTDLSPIVVSRICQTAEGKPYLEVDDKPFPVYGAQIRVDIFRSVDKLDWDEIELYFATAQDLGVNSVQVSYPWAFLEPKRDQYSFTEIDKIMELANEYDLKVELLWFSTNR